MRKCCRTVGINLENGTHVNSGYCLLCRAMSTFSSYKFLLTCKQNNTEERSEKCGAFALPSCLLLDFVCSPQVWGMGGGLGVQYSRELGIGVRVGGLNGGHKPSCLLDKTILHYLTIL